MGVEDAQHGVRGLQIETSVDRGRQADLVDGLVPLGRVVAAELEARPEVGDHRALVA